MPLLKTEQQTYKPFEYPWAYEAWKIQQQVHWIPEEVPMADDIKDWEKSLSESERNLVTQIFRFFTQGDIEVNDCYHRNYLNWFKPTEVVMMLTAFSNMETIHVDAYSHLLDSLGMPESEYQAFLEYEEMKAKHDYLSGVNAENVHELARTMAIFGGFTEGMQLFASFAILLNFPRFNKLKGMGQIIQWSVRDETLHCNSIIRLYHQLLAEHPEIDRTLLNSEIVIAMLEMIEHEDAFIDLAFEMGDIEGLSAGEVKNYIRYIANMRLAQLGFPEPFFDIPKNPLPWLDEQLNAKQHVNFFENRVVDYSKSATEGDWAGVFKEFDTALQKAA